MLLFSSAFLFFKIATQGRGWMRTVWEWRVVGDSRAGAETSKAFMVTASWHANKGWIFCPPARHVSAVEQPLTTTFFLKTTLATKAGISVDMQFILICRIKTASMEEDGCVPSGYGGSPRILVVFEGRRELEVKLTINLAIFTVLEFAMHKLNKSMIQ